MTDARDNKPNAPLPSKDRLNAIAAKLEGTKLPPIEPAAKELEKTQDPYLAGIAAPGPSPAPFLASVETGMKTATEINILSQAGQSSSPTPMPPWTEDDDNQLITYIKSSGSYKEISKKMKREVWQIMDRCDYLRRLREHFAETKKILGR